MSKRSTEKTAELVPRVVAAFLDAPPTGTPTEIVDAFNLFCARADEPLSGHLFFQMVEQAPIALSITDARANILYANRMFERLTGYRREQIIGRNESILSNRATPAAVYQNLWATVTAKRTWHGTLVNRTSDGRAYLAELTISPVLDGSGEVSHYLGMHRDISAVHALQQQVAHQKGLLESILDTAPVVVALLDAGQRVLLDNQEYKKLRGDLRGREPARVLLQAVAEQTGSDDAEFRNVEVRLEFTSGGPRWFVCSAVHLDDVDASISNYFKDTDRQTACLLLASEVTRQRREYERARMEQLRASLAEQQRINGMREALAAATFHVQQPLNLVNAATAMLSRNAEGSVHLLAVLDQIADAAQRAFDALHAALPAVDDEPVQRLNLNEVLQEVLELSTDRLLKNGIVIDWRPSVVLPVFLGRAGQVRALLMNIVDNAIVALSEAGTVNKLLAIRTAETAGVLILTVHDNGRGIPPADRTAVFQPLHIGWQNKTGHAGMGLAMAQEIATRHGGGIEIDDDVEFGCRVRIEFPVTREVDA